jgi:hypothetical protein
VANVGGPWIAKGTGYTSRAIAAAFQSAFAVGGAKGHDPDYEGEVDTVYLGCWRKETLLRIGLFDQELIRNQDDELNFRLRRHGGRIWQSPLIKSWYRPRSSLASLYQQYLQYGYWKVRVIQKHGRPASLRHLVPVCFALGLVSGWIPGLVCTPFGAVYGGALALYALLSLTFACGAARKTGWELFPFLPIVFFVYHLSYGLGFARGLVDFMLLRRQPSPSMTALTRPLASRE